MSMLNHIRAEDIDVHRLLARIGEGTSVSDATPDIEHQRQQFDPDPPEFTVCNIDTSADLATVVETLFRQLSFGSVLPACVAIGSCRRAACYRAMTMQFRAHSHTRCAPWHT